MHILPVALDFRPSGEKSSFKKMAIEIVEKIAKKIRSVNYTVQLLDVTSVFCLFVSHLTSLDSWAVPTELGSVQDVH